MASKIADEDFCTLCSRLTKYICIDCGQAICNRCSIFEDNESTRGWIIGKSVGYCKECAPPEEAGEVTQIENRKELDTFLESDTEIMEGERYCDEVELTIAEGTGEQEREGLEVGARPAKRKNRPGRRGKWTTSLLDDLIDIVLNNEIFKQKLIFRNLKYQQNGRIYEEILVQLRQRCSEKGEEMAFSVDQLRSKFKKCIAECKKAALTVKTASGISRFQDEKGFGKWFNQLLPVVQSRDSCQPDQAIEPSFSTGVPEEADQGGRSNLPNKFKKKEKKTAVKEELSEVISLLKSAVENDPMKEFIAFMKEDIRQSREHEMRLFQLMHSFASNETSHLNYNQGLQNHYQQQTSTQNVMNSEFAPLFNNQMQYMYNNHNSMVDMSSTSHSNPTSRESSFNDSPRDYETLQ